MPDRPPPVAGASRQYTVENDPPLQSIRLLQDRIADATAYPFNVPAIRSLDVLEFDRRVTFFVGENGSGKSTLLEAIAELFGLGKEGGSRNIRFTTSASSASTSPLANALRPSWRKKLLSGYFLRAESFFNVASYLDDIEDGLDPYGGKSLHAQSHGESFMALMSNRLGPGGFYLMDEPEAALSPQRQLSFLVVMNDLIERSPHTQFIIATHSPVLLAYPDAQILSFDGDSIAPIRYEDAAPCQVLRAVVTDRHRFIGKVLGRL